MKKISILEINNLLIEAYGIHAKIKELPGYEDLNYILDYKGIKSILKITVNSEAQLSVIPQVRVLDALHKTEGLKRFVPEVLPALSGEKALNWDYDGTKLIVRVLSFLEGSFMGEKSPPISFFSSLGTLIGNLDNVLSGLDEPLFRQLDLEWDLANFLNNEGLCHYIKDPYNKTLVEYFFLQNREVVAPVYKNLRKSLIHNDINDWNVLAANNKFTGLIDFGDMVFTATINELAIALAYAMMRQDDPLTVAFELVKGYHSQLALKEEELDLLYYLSASRLCTTIVMAAKNASNDPGNEYFQISAQPAWDVLHKWIRINPINARNTFYKACGLTIPDQTKSKNKLLLERNKYLPSSLSLSYNEPLGMTRSALQYMYDDEGNTYLDCVNNIPHVGHSHPRVVKAGQQQMGRLNTNTRYVYNSLNEYAKRLLSKFPDRLSKVLFVNSGSAAADLAIRLARNHTGKDNFIVLDHAYHGNVSTAIALSPYKFNHKGGSGKPHNTHIAPIPDTYRGKYRTPNVRTIPRGRPESPSGRPEIPSGRPEIPRGRPVNIGKKYADELRNMISDDEVIQNNLAGFIAESIPGCGGQIVLPENYLGEVYDTIHSYGGVCIADEVQNGFGRMGKTFWGFELYNVVPDIVILGKPMGNGHPIGAVVFTDEISASFENGLEFFSSFGGNPVSCEIGLAVLDAIEDGALQENARKVGEFIMAELIKLQKRENSKLNPVIGDVRGQGLFIGIELVKDIRTREPNPDAAFYLVNDMKKQGILLSTDGPDENVIKIKPPLCFTMDNAKELLKKIRLVLEA